VKSKTIFVCSKCGYANPKWLGKCPECQTWGSLNEVEAGSDTEPRSPTKSATVVSLAGVKIGKDIRTPTGITEVDRVLGGGIVPGALILLAGEPGIGKSTLALQISAALAEANHKVLYVTGEESLEQLKYRANRLGIDSENILVMAETLGEKVLTSAREQSPLLMVLDSVQTLRSESSSNPPGNISQIREIVSRLNDFVIMNKTSIILTGHVTKEGGIAGPKSLEHMVDAVLTFEGEQNTNFRILRANKNRFGSTDEIGVFSMDTQGLNPISDPSRILLSQRPKSVSGSTVVISHEGSRPMLVEMQALVTPSIGGIPRRTVQGLDIRRASLVIAVLEKRLGFRLSGQDIFLNVAGGIKIMEPGLDLGVALALTSSYLDKVVPPDVAVCGEVGLVGEVRDVRRVEARVREAERIGLKRCIVPDGSYPNHIDTALLIKVKTIGEAVRRVLDFSSP